MNKKNSLYTNIGVFWSTFHRFNETRKGSDTQDSFLNKLLNLYDAMIGTKTLEKIEKKYKHEKKKHKKRSR